MKPTVFNESVKEVKKQLLNEVKEFDLNNPVSFFTIEILINHFFRSSKSFSRLNFRNREIMVCMDPKNNEEEPYSKFVTDDYVIIGKITFKEKKNESGKFVTEDLDIEIFDSEDIEGFDRVRLRLLFED